MRANQAPVDTLAYYRSAVGPYPPTGTGKCPVGIFDPLWYSEIQGWTALYFGNNALVLVMAPIATHEIMATSGALQLLNAPQVLGIKQAVQAQQGLNCLPAMGVRQHTSHSQRVLVP